MKSALVLLLLLGLSPAVSQRQSEASVSQEDSFRTGDDLWDELRGLKQLVLSLKAAEVEQRQALRSVESRLRDGEVEAQQQRRCLDGQREELRDANVRTEADRKLLMELNSHLRRQVEELQEHSRAQAVAFSAEVSTLQSRLNISESSVEELKKKNTALAAELPFLQTRLRASESTVEQLRRKTAVLAVRLCNTESLMEELTKQTSAFPASNSSSEASELESRLNVRLEELNINTQVQRSRLKALEENLNQSAERLQLRLLQDQISEISSRLNSSQLQLHLDELKRSSADQTGRLKSAERRVDELQAGNTALTDRLSVGERRLEELQTQTSDQTSKLMNLQRRLNMTESLLEKNTELEVRLSVSDKLLEDLKTQNSVQSVQLSLLESRLTDNTAALEVRLRSTETQLETHTAVREAELVVVTARLNVSEEQLDELRTQNTDRLAVADRRTEELQEQLSAGEASVDQLKTQNEGQSALLTHIISRLEAAESHSSVLQSRLNRTEKLLQRLDEAHSGGLSALRTETEVLSRRLSDADSLMMKIQAETSVQSVQLSSMESRLTDSHKNITELEVRLSVSDKQLQDLKTQNSAQSVQLSLMESRLTDTHNNTAVLSFRLNETDDRLQKLTNTNSDGLRVAFSAGLTDSGSVGPFDEETTLIFSKTITNVGQAYNQTAGVFTAPVRGLYFFSFTAADYLKGYMGLYLYRNNQPILFNLDLNDHGGYASTSNGVALQLEEGDGVRLSLPASYRLYDDSRNFSVFSGFLLFRL